MIYIRDIRKTYDKRIILNINELVVSKGEIFGLVGNNGAGKTTLFRLILDLIQADNGEIRSVDTIVSKSESWKDYTSSYLDDSFLIDFLTPEEFFYFIGSTYGLTKQEVDTKLLVYTSFFNDEILNQRKKYIRDFSKGNKQKIGIVSALITDPKVLVLDEPFNSLDPSSQIILKRILIDYNKLTGATILISSHDLNHVTEICQRIILLEKGKVLRDITNDGNALSELNNYFAVEQPTN